MKICSILETKLSGWTSQIYPTPPAGKVEPARTSSIGGDNAAKQVFHKELAIVGAMRKAGVPVLAGTDTGNPFCFPDFSLHEELALLVIAGLTRL